MLFFLTSQPLWLSGLILVGLTSIIAGVGPALVRRHVKLEALSTNNEVAGFKFATIGVLYAVLLAFAIIFVWQRYNDAENNVAQEAGAAANIYRLSRGLDDHVGTALRDSLTGYLHAAISSDWPAMERGTPEPNATGRLALDGIYTALLTNANADPRAGLVIPEILRQIDLITQARRSRLITAEGIVPNLIWLVLFGGAILTIGFTFFFGTKNLRAQTAMAVVLSVIVFSELLIVVAIDRPFTGSIKVGPEPLVRVLADFAPATPASDSTTTKH
jgi:hypothetical protein